MYEKALPAGHPDIARMLDNLANLYQVQGRYAEGETLFKQALAMREKAFLSAGLNREQGGYLDAEHGIRVSVMDTSSLHAMPGSRAADPLPWKIGRAHV